jgi:hypothetical protein
MRALPRWPDNEFFDMYPSIEKNELGEAATCD